MNFQNSIVFYYSLNAIIYDTVLFTDFLWFKIKYTSIFFNVIYKLELHLPLSKYYIQKKN